VDGVEVLTGCLSVAYKGGMTGKQMQAARKRLGLTRRELGELLGLHWNSIARMERGELPVVKQTELAVRYLLVKTKKGERKRK
jgi:DNA-binding XRE family transcriptional regulator